jgi:dolichyl-phosphate-mannose-protein mannosyltransferase
MLVGFGGYLSGSNGTFKYGSGSAFPDDMNYSFQRQWNAWFGIIMIPLAYGTARNFRLTKKASWLAGILVLLDNAFCVISRFILLDSILLGFTSLAFFFFSGFHKNRNNSFGAEWWFYLLGTGFSLGLVSSVKWVGFFMVATVGLYTIEDLYEKWGDYKMPKVVYAFHWISRILALIVIPLVVYMFSFYLHFKYLSHSGDGDSNMPSLFQASLEGSSIGKGPRTIAFGSKVTIKNAGFGGSLLHSHASSYPEGSKQQQITTYGHKDDNNDWIVVRPHSELKKLNEKRLLKEPKAKLQRRDQIPGQPEEAEVKAEGEVEPENNEAKKDGVDDISEEDFDPNLDHEVLKEMDERLQKKKGIHKDQYIDSDEAEDEPREFIKNGDIIRLVHVATNRNLHSHNVKAPVTDKENEVSAYLERDLGDDNDLWIVEIWDDLIDNPTKRVQLLSTQFRLKHLSTGCYLGAYGVRLPEWGFGQTEVICKKKDDRSKSLVWNVEDHWNGLLDPAPAERLKSPFFKDFVHLNVAMWSSNNALIPDSDHDDQLASQPYHWPFMLKGIRMCGWGDDKVKYNMFGNPLIWWTSTISLIFLTLSFGAYMIRRSRKNNDWTEANWEQYTFVGKQVLVGWFFHYIPFYIMGRVMYVHHYFPALYFAVFGIPVIFDAFTVKFNPNTKLILCAVLTLTYLAMFYYFSELTFGMDFPSKQIYHKKWVSSWNFADEPKN